MAKSISRKTRTQAVELDIEDLFGRFIAQDILVRRMLFEMSMMRVAMMGGDDQAFDAQIRNIEAWRKSAQSAIEQMGIRQAIPKAAEAALSTIDFNLTDTLDAVKASKTISAAGDRIQ